jgi:hypothetical protein
VKPSRDGKNTQAEMKDAKEIISAEEFTVFYAWQSDSPSRDNRNFIESAIEAALKSIQKAGNIQSSPRLDKDTKGVPGIPDIANTIMEKIHASDLIVADVSFIGKAGEGKEDDKLIPNPNVMIELGYALSELGWERIIIVLNTSTGAPEDLPFDLRNRRWPIVYEIKAATEQAVKAEIKNSLTKQLQEAIEVIAKLAPRQKRGTTGQRLDALESMVSTLSGSVAQYTTLANLVNGLQKTAFGGASETADPKIKCQNKLNDLIQRASTGKFNNIRIQQGMFAAVILPTIATAPLPIFELENERLLNSGLQPLGVSGWSHQRYGDRIVTTSEKSHHAEAVTEITSDGCISAISHDVIAISEEVWAMSGRKALDETVCIPSGAFEKEIIEGVFGYLRTLKAIGTKGPWYIGFALINVKKSILYVSERFRFSGRPFEGDEIRPPILEIPENIELNDRQFQPIARALRPAFDYIWREHNYPRSFNYAESGDWIGQ